MDFARQPRLLVIDLQKELEPDSTLGIDRLAPIKTALDGAGFSTAVKAVQDPDGLSRLLEQEDPDLAFCTFFRFPGPAGEGEYASHRLARAGVPLIGSMDPVLEIALSKPRMKEVWREAGIPTPDWFVVGVAGDGSLVGIEKLAEAKSFPYFVKPAGEGNSRGIDAGSVVRTPTQLLARATMVAERYGEALIEGYLGGSDDSAEFTAAMIGNGPGAIVSAVQVGKLAPGPGLITEAEKNGHLTQVTPISDPKTKKAVERLARRAFACAGARDYARCDILLHEGRLYAIELNGQPMVPDPWFAACAMEAGLDPMHYLRAIVLAAIVRITARGEALLRIPLAMARTIPEPAFSRLSDTPRGNP